MEYLQEDPYSGHHHLPSHHDPYYGGGGGGGGGGGYHDNSYAGNTSFDRHSEQSFHNRPPPTSSYSDLPNGGAPHGSSHNMYQPSEHQQPAQQMSSRDDSYAGSYQGDPPPHSNGNYMDPYPSTHPHHQYNGGDPANNYSFQGDPQNPPTFNDHGRYPDEEGDQFPQPEDYREVHNRSTGAVVEDPYHYDPSDGYPQHQQPQQNNSFHEPSYAPQQQQQQGYDPYHEDDRYSDVPRSQHSLDHGANSYPRGEHPDSSLHHQPDDSFRHEPMLEHQQGLPLVRQDPFADSPFHNQQQPQEDLYGRGPSPARGLDGLPYSRQSYNDPPLGSDHGGQPYNDRGPPYDDRGAPYDERGTPYDDRGPPYDDRGPPYDDRGPPYDDQGPVYNDRVGGHPYPPGDMQDGYGVPQHQGYPQDGPDNGSNYGGGNNYPQDVGPPYLDDPNYPGLEQDLMQRMEQVNLNAPPPLEGRMTPAGDTYFETRQPDLQQVIDFLSSPDDNVKNSAVAYLQHLTFNDDPIKAKTRAMGGIPALIALLSHDSVDIHKNACGALQNLSYGRTNNDNKRAVKNENGIPELIRLLRKTVHEDVIESVTGVLWNLSSCEDLKQAIIDDGLAVLVNVVISRYAGFGNTANPWSTACRNTTGILRNVSSAGFDARKQLRECKGLVNSLINILKQAVNEEHSNVVDNKPVENTVCTLRNLSYRIQEVVEPDFYKKRTLPRQMAQMGGNKSDPEVGCFGNKSKSKPSKNALPKVASSSPVTLPPLSIEYRALWGAEIHSIYSALLRRCTNPITMEAAAGAIQNLTACDWQPAVDSRQMMRKEKGLPLMVDLLSAESDRVVCATATALRNLAIDEKNKELIGKYAIRQLASRLPRDNKNNMPDDTICAIVATLYEVIKDNQYFALALMKENGLPALMHINTSDRRYLARTLKFTLTLLKTMWTYKPLHAEYAKLKLYQPDFTTSKALPRQEGSRPPDLSQKPVSSNHTTPYNTLSRPISGQGYDDSTLSSHRAHQMHPHQRSQPTSFPSQPTHPPQNSHGGYYTGDPRLPTPTPADSYRDLNRSNASIHDPRDDGNYSRGRKQPEEIHMNDFCSGYAPLDEPQPHHNHKPPVGGVPLFPGLSSGGSPSPYPGDSHGGNNEPLYAQVNKGSRRHLDPYSGSSDPNHGSSPSGGHLSVDAGGDAGGVDSWV